MGSFLNAHWTFLNFTPLFQTLYKTQVRELKEECEEKNKLYKDVQQSLQELQEERWTSCLKIHNFVFEHWWFISGFDSVPALLFQGFFGSSAGDHADEGRLGAAGSLHCRGAVLRPGEGEDNEGAGAEGDDGSPPSRALWEGHHHQLGEFHKHTLPEFSSNHIFIQNE